YARSPQAPIPPNVPEPVATNRLRPSAGVADRRVGELLYADVDQNVALDPGVNRAGERLGHLGDVEAVEMVEVDGVVAVDVAESLVDQDRVGRHRGLPQRADVHRVAQQ